MRRRFTLQLVGRETSHQHQCLECDKDFDCAKSVCADYEYQSLDRPRTIHEICVSCMRARWTNTDILDDLREVYEAAKQK